jgi:hypothetical protein
MKTKKLYTVHISSNTSSFNVYVIAKNEDDAISKAKANYKYCSCTSAIFIDDVIL